METEQEINARIEALLKANKYNRDDIQDDGNLFVATAKYVRLMAENLGEQATNLDAVQRGVASLDPFLNNYNFRQTNLDFERISLDNSAVLGKRGTRIEEPVPGVAYDVPDYQRIFQRVTHGPGGLGAEMYVPRPDALFRKDRSLENRIQNSDVFFSREDYEFGYMEQEESFRESSQYVPFFFEDLRSQGRRIYFRAFLTTFSEQITPEWSADKYYGRVDEVPIYKNTSRTFSLGFTIAAFSPAGFSTMWKKVNNLSKLTYPTFGNDRVLKASPVCRIRVGDVMADGRGLGLPGYIKSLEFNYSEGPWEISEYNGLTNSSIELGRAPMVINVTISFQVIHELNPGLDQNYNMNVTNFRRIGDNGDNYSIPSQDKNPSPEVEDSEDPGSIINEPIFDVGLE